MNNANTNLAINSATYLPRYEVVHHATAGQFMSMYEAVKVLENLAAEGVVTDHTHIRRDNRVVAFWCHWRNTARATDYQGARAENGARADERALING